MTEIIHAPVLIVALQRGKTVEILYKNHRGETGKRQIIPECLWLGTTEWHPRRQWLLDAWDVGKQDRRSFALSEIHEVNGVAVAQPS